MKCSVSILAIVLGLILTVESKRGIFNKKSIKILTNITFSEPRFAPYIYTGMDLVGLNQKYGLKAVTLAFVLSKGGQCTPTWDGQEAIDNQNAISKIKAFEKVGGHVIVATGGAAGSYLENACHTVQALAGAYKHVLAVTGSTHLDLDIEQAIPIDTVTQAVAQVQKENPSVTFSLTIGSDNHGITSQGMSILRSAVKHGVNVDIVNAMAMDYTSDKAWGGAVVDVAEATHKQMKQIWPSKSDQELYSMIGKI